MPTTHHPNGVVNVAKTATLGRYTAPDPTKNHEYMNDFDHYVTSDWTATTVESGTAGTAAIALGNDDGGVLVITNGTTDDDSQNIQKIGESFQFETGKGTWFKTRFKINAATQSDLFIGLAITDTDVITATSDGVYFRKDDGDTNLDFVSERDGVLAESLAVTTLSDDTYVAAGFYYDGGTNIAVYIDDVLVSNVTVDSTSDFPTNEALTLTMAVRNGDAGSEILTMDYIYCSKAR